MTLTEPTEAHLPYMQAAWILMRQENHPMTTVARLLAENDALKARLAVHEPAAEYVEQMALLPCPFCGSSGPTKVGYWPDRCDQNPRVRCCCGAAVGGGLFEAVDRQRWNTRALPEPKLEPAEDPLDKAADEMLAMFWESEKRLPIQIECVRAGTERYQPLWKAIRFTLAQQAKEAGA